MGLGGLAYGYGLRDQRSPLLGIILKELMLGAESQNISKIRSRVKIPCLASAIDILAKVLQLDEAFKAYRIGYSDFYGDLSR